MKKLVFVSAVLAMLLVVSGCFAESEYTIHNGTKFGMSSSEVVSLEKSSGFTLAGEDLFSGTEASKILKGEGKIAGVDDSEVLYLFDKNDKLYSAIYALPPWFKTLRKDLSSVYNSVETALVNKYGTPDESWVLIANKIGYEPLNYFWSSVEGNPMPSYSSWLVEQEDGTCVVIVHFQVKASIVSGMDATFHYVGYQQYTIEEFNAQINDITQQVNENESQLANDL